MWCERVRDGVVIPEDALVLEGGEVLCLAGDVVELGVAEADVHLQLVWVGEPLVGLEVESDAFSDECTASLRRHLLTSL